MTSAITDIASAIRREARDRDAGATSFGVEQTVTQTSSGAPERHAGVDEVAFDAVLSLATVLLEVGPSGLGGQASPSQMFEANPDGDRFGMDRLRGAMADNRRMTLKESVDAIVERIVAWRGDGRLSDDVSILAVEIDRTI